MDIMLLRTFQRQLALQCRYLLRAANEVTDGLDARDIEQIFYALQNLLSAGANISKALWGQGGKFSEKRKSLRDSVGVTDDSPLRQVSMRNNFEHFDERLDRWWMESSNHNYADMNIGPKNRAIVGLDQKDMFRFFDPETTDLTFWGEEFNIRSIVMEVRGLLPRLEAEARKPHWEPLSTA